MQSKEEQALTRGARAVTRLLESRRPSITQRIPRAALERKLGPVALKLLEAWWGFRSDNSGETFAKLATAAQSAGISIAQARLAARRLREAGLVEARGGVRRPDGVRLFYRCVRGMRDRAPWEHVVHIQVPHATAQWFRSAPDACTWGGARFGAGRRSGARASAPIDIIFPNRSFRDGQLPAPRKEAIEARARLKMRMEQAAFTREPGGFSIGVPAPTAGSGDDFELQLEAQRRARIADALMPCPTRSQIGEPSLPWPPKVKKTDSDIYRARLLATAYRGAIEMLLIPTLSGGNGVKARLMMHRVSFARGAITASKHFKRLVAAAKVMEELKIPPAAWAAWSVLVWKNYRHPEEAHKKKRPSIPSVAWVFATTRMNDHLGWFNSEANDYLGGRMTPGPSWRSFADRRAKAVAQIIIGDDDPEDVICRMFPESYDRAIENARRESDRITKDRKARAQDGEWVWTRL